MFQDGMGALSARLHLCSLSLSLFSLSLSISPCFCLTLSLARYLPTEIRYKHCETILARERVAQILCHGFFVSISDPAFVNLLSISLSPSLSVSLSLSPLSLSPSLFFSTMNELVSASHFFVRHQLCGESYEKSRFAEPDLVMVDQLSCVVRA